MQTDPPIPQVTIRDFEFQQFQEYFYRKTGIQFEPTKRYFVDKRILERMEVTGSPSFRSYFVMLRFQASGEELQQLTNSMTVNETYFFREDYQFQCMVNSMLPRIISLKKQNTPIRIWSIPSSSGEEAYSIAIYLLEYWAGISEWDVEIISSDIDTQIISQARKGLYSPRSVQHLPVNVLMKYFKKTPNGYQISDDLRESVEFTRVNLTVAADTRGYRDFDIIFCRNLLIYFDELSRKAAAETFYDALRPGGYLCLGHSESMSRISSIYQIQKFPEAIVYQKPLEVR
jgi:chemotaxis protein methyltransferase CheR